MYGTRSAEDMGDGPLQGEPRSQEVLPAAPVKYMDGALGLIRFN